MPTLTEQASRRATDRMLDSARDIATMGGSDSVVMRSVAREAGVAIGTLYRAYASKAHLLIAALGRELDAVEIEDAVAAAASLAPDVRVRVLIEGLVEAMHRNPLASEAMGRALVTADGSAVDQVNSILERLHRMFAVAVGGSDPTAHHRQVAWVILDVAIANVIAWLHGRATLDDVAARLEYTVKLLSARSAW